MADFALLSVLVEVDGVYPRDYLFTGSSLWKVDCSEILQGRFLWHGVKLWAYNHF